MSETEGHSGTLKLVEDFDGDYPSWVKKETGFSELPDWAEHWEEVYEEHSWDNRENSDFQEYYYNRKHNLLFLLNDESFDPSNFTTSSRIENSIEYTTIFYNGGAHLGEVLDKIVDDEFQED